MPAYTVAEEAQSMALESAETRVQPMLAEMRQLFAAHDRKLDQEFAERDRKFDEHFAELGRKVDERGRDLDSFKEVVGAKLDAMRRELRLVWGVLSILVTLLIVVFGFVFRA